MAPHAPTTLHDRRAPYETRPRLPHRRPIAHVPTLGPSSVPRPRSRQHLRRSSCGRLRVFSRPLPSASSTLRRPISASSSTTPTPLISPAPSSLELQPPASPLAAPALSLINPSAPCKCLVLDHANTFSTSTCHGLCRALLARDPALMSTIPSLELQLPAAVTRLCSSSRPGPHEHDPVA